MSKARARRSNFSIIQLVDKRNFFKLKTTKTWSESWRTPPSMSKTKSKKNRKTCLMPIKSNKTYWTRKTQPGITPTYSLILEIKISIKRLPVFKLKFLRGRKSRKETRTRKKDKEEEGKSKNLTPTRKRSRKRKSKRNKNLFLKMKMTFWKRKN